MDIVHRKWIKIDFTMVATANRLIDSKKEMKEYADELGWVVEVDKEGNVRENGARYYEVSVIPNKDRLISPEELRLIKDKLFGFSYNLLEKIMANKEFLYTQQALNMLTVKKPNKVEMRLIISDTVYLDYKLVDRIELEKKDVNLAKFLFTSTIEEHFKNLDLGTGILDKITKSKEIQFRNDFKKRVFDWFKIKIR